MCATRRRLCSMRMFRASRSPCAIRSRYIRSSSAFSGRGKEPLPPPERRRVKNRLLSISKIHAVNICHTSIVPLYSARVCPYVNDPVPCGLPLRNVNEIDGFSPNAFSGTAKFLKIAPSIFTNRCQKAIIYRGRK